MKVQLSDFTLADDINIRQGLREDAVERYTEILDDLPPITLWKQNGKLCRTWRGPSERSSRPRTT